MCGRYGFSIKSAIEIYSRFEIVNTLVDYKPRWNIAPGQMNPVITVHSPKQISRMLWGLIPSFAKDDNYKYKTINARSETINILPTFRQSILRRRCLVPATGFYEPDKKNKKTPPFTWHYFTLKNQDIFAFAGIYDVWIDPKNGKELYSYSIITTEPNETVGKYHDRMPVILNREDEDLWVNPDMTEFHHIQKFFKSYKSSEMNEWQVEDKARNPRLDSEDLIQPVKEVLNTQESML